jgi:hypothetical protein
MSSLDKKLLNEQLENYQIQRHDFLNDFQVIRGYLQLNMPDKALEYIDEALLELLPQQEVYKIGQKTMQAIFLSLFFGLRLLGVKMVLRLSPEMKEREFWLEGWQEEYAQQFYGYTKECLSLVAEAEEGHLDEMLAEIHLNSLPDGFVCEFKLYSQGKIYLQNNFHPV